VEVLQRLQPLDFLLVVLWAAIVGWGLQTGLVRQIGMLLGVYVAAIGASTVYRQGGQLMSLAFGADVVQRLEFITYLVVFVVVLGLVALVIWRAYPLSRLGRSFGLDNVIGAALGAVWGALLLIAIVTLLRFYIVTPWRGQETTQQSLLGQVQASQVAPVLEVVFAPLWQIMTPWFPSAVLGRR
jgi:uncharacterized membrane protein required for colicin V production